MNNVLLLLVVRKRRVITSEFGTAVRRLLHVILDIIVGIILDTVLSLRRADELVYRDWSVNECPVPELDVSGLVHVYLAVVVGGVHGFYDASEGVVPRCDFLVALDDHLVARFDGI